MLDALQKMITRRYAGRDLPVALVLPDGARVPLSSSPELDVIARSLNGLKALATPAMGRLARAYVHDDVDFTGSARRVLAIAERMVGDVANGADSTRGRVLSFVHHRRSNRRNIAHHYDVSNAFYRMWLDRRMVYSCAYF
ncbi:MAG TPA: class I SAM-dependent methyltransferase, partial [Casimicrobiaceae bacterium]